MCVSYKMRQSFPGCPPPGPPTLQVLHLHAKSGKARIAEVCECNWPCFNLDLLLVFLDSTLILNIPANQGAVYRRNRYFSWFASRLHHTSVSQACCKAFALQEISRKLSTSLTSPFLIPPHPPLYILIT